MVCTNFYDIQVFVALLLDLFCTFILMSASTLLFAFSLFLLFLFFFERFGMSVRAVIHLYNIWFEDMSADSVFVLL